MLNKRQDRRNLTHHKYWLRMSPTSWRLGQELRKASRKYFIHMLWTAWQYPYISHCCAPIYCRVKISNNVNNMCIKRFDCEMTWFFLVPLLIQKCRYFLWAICSLYPTMFMHDSRKITDTYCRRQFIECISEILSQFLFLQKNSLYLLSG